MNWSNRKILVTGGASFIGSHLVQALVNVCGRVRVVDNLSSGKLANIQGAIAEGNVEFIEGDLLDQSVIRTAVKGMDCVFHLAADHGGRGYLETHQAACASNLALDGMLFFACRDAGVEKVIFASSGCVYPAFRQTDPKEIVYLTENIDGPPYDADNMYGYAKLMGELTLRALYRDYGMKSVSCRYFTVYGERGKEDHALMAMMARALIRQNPFKVWGTGEQIRNWTYVGDIVDGTILAAEKIDNGQAVNLGTMERTRVIDAVHQILGYMDYAPEIELQPDMPTGPYNRVADIGLAKQLLSWEPKVNLTDGLRRTIDWYVANRRQKDVALKLETILSDR